MKRLLLILTLLLYPSCAIAGGPPSAPQPAGSGTASDTVYGAGWDGDTTGIASKNTIYDKVQLHEADALAVHGITDTADVVESSAAITANAVVCGDDGSQNVKDCTSITIGDIDAGDGELEIPNGLLSGLPAVPVVGDIYQVTDGDSATDCTNGSSTFDVICMYNGAAWTAVSGGGGTVDLTSDVTGLLPVANINLTGTWDYTTATIDLGDTTLTLPPLSANEIESSEIATIVDSIYIPAYLMSADGTNCGDPSQTIINSGPEVYTISCADDDASQIEGSFKSPDSWDAGNLVFQLEYVQTAADTSAFEWDIYVQCRGAGETVNNTWETAVNVIDAAMTGSNAVDVTESGNVTCASDAAGDTILWRIEVDAAGSGAAITTVEILGLNIEYTSNVGD